MRKKINIKNILIPSLILIILFIFIIFSIEKINNTNEKNQLAQAIKSEEEIKVNKNITTLYFVGDMMLTRGVKNSVNKNFDGEYNRLFENITELKNADILFANLEGDVSDKGNNVGSIYSFRMDKEILPVLKNAGFDILNFANNHVGDWSIAAFKDTLSGLKDNDILKTGAGINKKDAENPTIIEKNGIKFGFLGFSDVGPNWLEAKEKEAGILLAGDSRLADIVKNAKEKTDVLIVSFHFGEEYNLTHNKRQSDLAHKAIDNGADLIIGHHPHVMEDIEEYNGKTIVYSLGNFIFDQYFSKDTMEGMLFSVKYDGTKLIEKSQKLIKLNKFYQPEGITNIEDKKISNETSNNCPVPKKDYIDMTFLNIRQTNPLPEKYYIPKNLKPLGEDIAKTKGFCLTEEVKDAFTKMKLDAEKENIFIKVSSAFRSYDIQKILYENNLKNTGKDDPTTVAKAGYSEHQLGSAIDITGLSLNYEGAKDEFANTPEDIWLQNNAYLYGFIQSYPKNKENITGYKYEPWHYRYVGKDKAKEIIEKNTTIIEFLDSINKK